MVTEVPGFQVGFQLAKQRERDKTMFVDLDIQYRSANMYFNKFNEMTYETTCPHISLENLMITRLHRLLI